MAYIQRSIPPTNRVFTFSLRDFSGGLNNRTNLLIDSQASDLLNMRFTDDTVMERRFGTTSYNNSNIGHPVVFLNQYKPYTDPDVLVSSDGTSLYMDGTSVQSVSGNIHGVNHMGKYFYADGSKFYVYGKFPQSTDTYTRVVGTPTDVYKVMEIVSPPVGYTPLDTTNTRGVTAYDYTNGKVWYEPCANEMSDAYKNSNVSPVNSKYICSLNGRLYVSGNSKADDSIYVSDVNNPYYFPSAVGLQVPPNSDSVVGMVVFNDSVVVGRKNDVFQVEGKTNNPNLGLDMFQMHKLNIHTGFANNDAVAVVHNSFFFIGNDGMIYSMAPMSMYNKTLVSTVINKTIDLFKAPFHFTFEDVRTACSYFLNEFWYVSIKDFVLVYSYRLQAWTVYKGLNARSFYEMNDALVWGNQDGKIMKFSTDYLDEGKPFKSYWTSKYFDMNDANTFKQFRDFFIVAHTFEEFNSDILMTFEVDYAEVDSQVVISNQLSVFGKTKFGERFINRNINASAPFTISRRARTIRFTFRCGYNIIGEVATVADLEAILGKENDQSLYKVGANDLYLYHNSAWELLPLEGYNQAMRVYQVNGDYELRGKR